MSVAAPEVSVVLPTYNRLDALRRNFSSLLELDGVSEIVVVVDGSTDGTQEWLARLEDPRIRVVAQSQRGSPAARNTGIAAAVGEWILMTEDDCYLPREFVVTLLDVAQTRDAQIVSAPWVATYPDEDMQQALDRAHRNPVARIRLGTSPGKFPIDDLETPFLNGVVLARRVVFDAVRYNESLRVNAWREETSMFLAAIEAGYRCVLTPRTASFQLGQWVGGQRRPRLSYEVWVVRNNWRFLRDHREALRQLGEIRGPVSAQASFVAKRLATSAVGSTRARLPPSRRRTRAG
jgi:glycosyltransferase involved in cell wall biosynthesis